jgi:hypothetical protein
LNRIILPVVIRGPELSISVAHKFQSTAPFANNRILSVAADTTLAIEEEVRRIEEVIREYGSCLIREDQLPLLFTSADSNSKRFVLLASLAHEREWSFEFQPHNGDVRITPLPSPP